jgi:DNA-binding MarR family transcriptional regulator
MSSPSPSRRLRDAPPQVQGCTCNRLRRLTRRVTAVYDHALAPCGLRGTQFSLLSNLLALQAPTLSVLAEAMDMERTTLTRNLRPLIAAGWVSLRPGHNPRNREARMTSAGRAKWVQAKPHWRRAQSALNSALGEAEVARLHRLVDRYLPRLRSPVRSDA